MPLKTLFAFAAVLTTKAGAESSVQANDAVAESVSSLVSEMRGSLLTLGRSKFRAGDHPHKTQSLEEMIKAGEEQEAMLKKLQFVPASHPMWKQTRAAMKQNMLDHSKDAREWIGWAAEEKYDLYLQKSCNFFGGAELVLEKSTGKLWPTDAYWCGNPGIDWSGGVYGGKPVNDYCGAAQGDTATLRAEAVKICGRYTDKEIVLGMFITWKDDPRGVNLMMSDCLMDEIDADINYCHKCAGRCSGGSSGGSMPAAAAPAASPDTPTSFAP